ncbi:MAG: Agmatinase [Methanomicrobiales archaeon 53_19]|jgi:agmatinase|uniref:agmatinase n=1 Tax=Methanocalculus sp. TaxID=2004547 RepID=UPI0007480251|nr:agmatinase [Methanocalculus sp.]KUK71475.1 MAG: Agmatinase [Methanocalculus sp. 52_23]KUL04097.1 MAG: Agmatinase [Methanomicrobiales archaeon 53_19]HIJ07405.1 agmatinase [Methanocalculus sp.]
MQSFSNSLFADAEASYEEARYVIFGVPYDGTTSYKPGTRAAPNAIRAISYNFEPYMPEYGFDLTEIPFTDLGDLYPAVDPEMVVDQVEDTVSMILSDGKVPVMLGGEHSVTIGAVRAAMPEWYVVCDAHLDFQNEYRGSLYNHDCVSARVRDLGIGNIIIIGARSGSKEEFKAAGHHRIYTADEVHDRGIIAILDEVKAAIADDPIYLSIDADAIDSCLTPGLGTPDPFGITHWDLRSVIRALAGQAVAFDYVEVLPNDSEQTAAVAAKMIREFIGSREHAAKKKR